MADVVADDVAELVSDDVAVEVRDDDFVDVTVDVTVVVGDVTSHALKPVPFFW